MTAQPQFLLVDASILEPHDSTNIHPHVPGSGAIRHLSGYCASLGKGGIAFDPDAEPREEGA